MANNPKILCTNVFLSDNDKKRCRIVTEKWAEYIRLMEENKRSKYLGAYSAENETV